MVERFTALSVATQRCVFLLSLNINGGEIWDSVQSGSEFRISSEVLQDLIAFINESCIGPSARATPSISLRVTANVSRIFTCTTRRKALRSLLLALPILDQFLLIVSRHYYESRWGG